MRMSDGILFKDTSAWMDTVDLAMCLFIYEVCNDCQFGHLSGSDFVNFMNLKPTVHLSPCVRKRTCASATWCCPYRRPSSRVSVENSGRKISCNVAAYPSHITTSTATTCAHKVRQERTVNTANPPTEPSKKPDN